MIFLYPCFSVQSGHDTFFVFFVKFDFHIGKPPTINRRQSVWDGECALFGQSVKRLSSTCAAFFSFSVLAQVRLELDVGNVQRAFALDDAALGRS